ncbi:hypothetical protein RGQ13_14305 [Thalassotalea psychrophila]|uniref:Uncharacterized protein n=1 Tax=Thalassotalea psychrophila TaxID=3065647 RepID=A0ABY9TRX4_9GAMM|nr:hypothetical protein RGQ13_14305 [Colwelliaceae bacterium SQ149]
MKIMKLKYLLITIFNLALIGCNDDDNSSKTIDKIDIYATHGGNFGRAFMLGRTFSSNTKESILALGVGSPSYPYVYTSKNGAEVTVRELVKNFQDISEIIVNTADGNTEIDAYLSVIPVTDGGLLSNKAFSQLDTIYVIPEGTSIFEYEKYRIDNIISFAAKAKENGVKNVKLVLWDSIDEQTLLNSDLQIGRLKSNGVDYEFINFNAMSSEISDLKTSSGLISTGFYIGSINIEALEAPVFKESETFDADKESIVLFGSYTRDEPNVSYVNQVDILKNLETTIDLSENNLIFKGHPSEISVNDWIDDNSSDISYFLSFPYEIWQLIGEGSFNYTYDNLEYNMSLPKQPLEMYSIMSTTLYGEDANKIKKVLGYNNINSNSELTDEYHSGGIAHYDLYSDWITLTGNTVTPFEYTYDWINNK